MEVDSEWRRTGCGREEKRRAILRHQPRRILAEACPDRGDRQQIGQVERVQEDAANIPISISGKTASPRLDSIDCFQTAREPEVLNLLHDQSRVLMQSVEILVEADDVAGILRKLDIS